MISILFSVLSVHVIMKKKILGRDGLPAHCYVYYRHADTTNVKKMIEWEKNVDICVIEGKLSSLSEFDRILSSKLCRRQSVLGLLDEFSISKCKGSNVPCDNCKLSATPDFCEVSYEVFSVLMVLKDCNNIDSSMNKT